MNQGAEIKIQMLRNSMSCFTCALLALIPVVGLAFAVASLVLAGKARVAEKQFWNAARPYRLIGVGVVAFLFIVWIVAGFSLALHAIHSGREGGFFGGGEGE